MNAQRKWKAAVIGTGNVAQKAHLPFYQNNDAVDLIAVCGRDFERTRFVAESFGIENVFTEVEEMLQTCKPDVVSVCSPNNLHYTHVMHCLNAGCGVLCEKPPAVNYKQAKEMQAKAGEKGLLLAYNFQQRYLWEVALIKERMAQNFFGRIYHIKATFIRRRGIPGWGSFTNMDVQGGGALIDIGSHVLDLALHLLDYPALKSALGSVYDYIGKGGGKGQFGEWEGNAFTVEDCCFAHLQLANDCSIGLETAFALHTEKERTFSVEIFGEKGGAIFPPLKLFSDKNGEAMNSVPAYEPEAGPQEKGLRDFLAACEGKPSIVCTAKEGMQLQQIIQAIYASAKNIKPV